MAYLTVFVSAVMSVLISVTTSRSFSHQETPVRSITGISYKGVVPWKRFTCPALYGRYPHPDSCEYFFVCRFGWPTLMQCSKDYRYNEEKEQCMDRKKVRCRLRGGHEEIYDKNVKEKEKVVPFKCPYIWGTFAHPRDCSKYFVCLHSVPTLLQCYTNFLFDNKIRKCIPKTRVRCGKRLDIEQMKTSKEPLTLITTMQPVATTASDSSTTTESVLKFFCPFPRGRFADPDDCSQFYECHLSVPYFHKCPESTLYDEKEEECLEEQTVKCDDRPGGIIGGLEPEVDEKEILFCPYTWGIFEHPEDCSKYVICTYNVPKISNCRRNELFHARFRRCLPKGQVFCDDRVNPDDKYLLPSGETNVDSTTTSVRSTTSANFSTLTPTTVKDIQMLSTHSSIVPTTSLTMINNTLAPTTIITSPPFLIKTPISKIPITTSTSTTSSTTYETTVSITTSPISTTTIEQVTRSTQTRKSPVLPENTIPDTQTTTESTTSLSVTNPNTPQPINCNEEDLDCITDETVRVEDWIDEHLLEVS